MDEIDTLKRRIEELEQASAHQDRLIEELNAALAGQWRDLDALKRRLQRLDEEMRELESGVPAPPGQKPPHY